MRSFCLAIASLALGLGGCGDDGASDTDPGGSTSDTTGTTAPTTSSTTSSTTDTTTTSTTTAGTTEGSSSTGSGSTGDGTGSTGDGTTGGEELVTWLVPDSATQFCADPDTVGATVCPEGDGTYVGQDGDYTINPPTYTVSSPGGDDIVSDDVTGLVWTVDFSGEVLYDAAVTHCETLASESFAGRSDWRLPTRREISGIWDIRSWSSGDNVFPPEFGEVIPSNAIFWTSTPVAGAAGENWAASGNWTWLEAVAQDDSNYDGHHARCVSGDPTPSDVYTETDGGDTITHENTGLVWTSAVTSGLDWAGALSHCESLDLASQTDWRLPTLKEVYAFIDESHDVDTGLLPDPISTTSGALWTSTPATNVEIYVVQIGDGHGSDSQYSATAETLCVRGGTRA